MTVFRVCFYLTNFQKRETLILEHPIKTITKNLITMSQIRLAITSAFLIALSLVPASLRAQVQVREEKTSIPTYLVGNPELDPYFFTGRTYQGAAGHVYPYPIYDILTDERVDRDYNYVTLENEYTSIGILPEIGGRIFAANDKQNGYDFFYRQHVIRPALIGMIGSWISGGVEWNIPHHHRASSTLNAGYQITENEDGSKTVWIGETELRQRLKWDIALTMYPGKSYVEAKFIIQNRTPLMQTFLYWANVSVHANKDYQVQFPPHTAYGTSHSKTQYTDWPETAVNGQELDTSWWKNWKGSNSTFAVNYTDDFLSGYDFGADAGTIHFANHHLVPGKKFFLWGTESVWNEMLTEEDGAYLELMVGTLSDNQPDYSWLGPNEVRTTTQYWYPIKGIGGAKEATLEAAVNLERTAPSSMMVGFNVTAKYDDARILVKEGGKVVCEERLDINPDTPWKKVFSISSSSKDSDLYAAIYDADGVELVSYSPAEDKEIERPHPADRPGRPVDYESVEELLLAGQRLEEFHNARVSPLPYYEEALRRDPKNSRTNVNLGIYYARQAQWEKAEGYLQTAYQRLTGLHYMPDVAKTGIIYHTNPKDGEMLYYLGVISLNLNKEKEAENFFWKSVWYPGFQSPSYLELAKLYWKQGKEAKAMEAIDNSLDLGGRSTVAKFYKAYFLSSTGRTAAARELLRSNIEFDSVDWLSRIELARLDKNTAALDDVIAHMGIPLQEVLEVTTFYNAVGAYREAVELLDYVMANCPEYASTPMQKEAVEPFTKSPLLNYMAGYYTHKKGDSDKALEYYRKAAAMSTDYCFPSRIEEQKMLEDVIALNPSDYKAYYYLGNLLYYFEQKDKAIEQWEKSASIYPDFGLVYRNLGFAADHHLKDKALAASWYNKAIAADNTDPKFFQELDIIEEAIKVPSYQRLAKMDKNKKTIFKSDDATSRLVSLYVDNGKYKQALDILNTRHFRVWEGGRTVYTQFVDAHLLNGLGLLSKKQARRALDDFLAAGTFPRNLETNELSTGPIVAKVAYHQGIAYKALGMTSEARAAFERCIATSTGGSRRAGSADESKYYVAMSQKELGRTSESLATIDSLQQYVDERLAQAGATSVVDIYSKFGEDGSSDTIIARNIYIQGLVHLAKGDKADARDCFNKSLSINPSNIWAKYYLGTCK